MGLDWSPFGGNPVPGDPGALRGLAQQFRDFSDQVRQQAALLQNIHDGVGGVWTGPAARSFSPHLGRLPGQLGELHTSYGEAADALDGYWPQLQQAQSQAVSALAKAHAALQAQQAAKVAQQGDRQQYQDQQAQQAALAQQQGIPFTPSPYVPSPGVTAQATAANAAYQAAIQLKDQAVSQATAAARRAAGLLDGAARQQLSNPVGGLFGAVVSDLEAGFRDAEDFFRKNWGELAGGAMMLAGLPPPGDIRDLRRDLDALGHDAQQFLKSIQRGLDAASEALGGLSLALAVIGLVGAPFGIGEAADFLNEVVLGLKTGVDIGRALDGEDVTDEIEWDLAGLATAGLGRLAEAGGDVAKLTEAGQLVEKGVAAMEESLRLRELALEIPDEGQAIGLLERSLQKFREALDIATTFQEKLDGYLAHGWDGAKPEGSWLLRGLGPPNLGEAEQAARKLLNDPGGIYGRAVTEAGQMWTRFWQTGGWGLARKFTFVADQYVTTHDPLNQERARHLLEESQRGYGALSEKARQAAEAIADYFPSRR